MGDRIVALIPKYRSWGKLPLQDGDSRLIGFAQRDEGFHPLDPAGAVEASARAKVHRDAVRFLDHIAPNIDPIADNKRHAAMLPPDVIAPIGATISAPSEAKEIVAGINEPSVVRFERGQRESLSDARKIRALEDKYRDKIVGGLK